MKMLFHTVILPLLLIQEVTGKEFALILVNCFSEAVARIVDCDPYDLKSVVGT